MASIIEWPYSQICQDCKNAHWITPNEKHSLIYPAAVCQIDYYPDGRECSKWDNQNNSVELISAGYEWTCPACNQRNTIMEIRSTVSCKHCQRTYQVDNYVHAYE